MSKIFLIKNLWPVLVISGLLSACSNDKIVHSAQIKVLGTVAEITIVNGDAGEIAIAMADVEKELKIIDHIGYTFNESSELHQLNSSIADGKPMVISDELVALINIAKEISIQSDGLLNPALGELTALWEFHCEKETCTDSPYPDEVSKLIEIKEQHVIKKHPAMSDVHIKGNTVTSTNRDVKLEFGDIIRGFAMDLSIEHLRAMGIKNAMVVIGEDTRIIGHKNNHPWWVAIHDGRNEHMLGTLELEKDSSVVTVHALSKSHDKRGSLYRHVVNPKTGLPSKGISTITVIHESAAAADAAATAIMIAGYNNWKEVADKMGVTSILLYDDNGTLYVSPALSDKIHWKERVAHKFLVP